LSIADSISAREATPTRADVTIDSIDHGMQIASSMAFKSTERSLFSAHSATAQ
jgi:hypothetical protein